MNKDDPSYKLIASIRDNVAAAETVRARVHSIANSMYNLGIMVELADELIELVDSVVDSAKRVQGDHGLKTSSDLEEAERMAKLLLLAATKGFPAP